MSLENVGPTFWHAVGITGGLIFYGRFYVQWIASERAGRSVMPLLFWYMSSIGSILLTAFAVATRSPLGTLGQSFNLVVYGRNLTHIWREKGTLTPWRRRVVNAVMVFVVALSAYLMMRVWLGEYFYLQDQPEDVERRAWFWLAVGVIGQALFAARFLVQLAATELKRRSVVPAAFWYFSVAASTLQAASFVQRREWVFAIGMLATLVIYLRNIWLVRTQAGRTGRPRVTPNRRLGLLLLGCAVLFAAPSFFKDLWTPDEPRYAEVAREMMVAGDYLVPRLNGERYVEKPPLLFWLIVAASLPVGDVIEFTTRVPSICSALAVIVLTFALARRMFGEREAVFSTMILATTGRFWWQSHTGQIDMLLTACTTLSLYALWRWRETPRGRWIFAFHAGTALGLLAKGPPALLVTLVGAVAALWRDGDRRRRLALWFGFPLAIGPVTFWFALSRQGQDASVSEEFAGTIGRQILGRVFAGISHHEPLWYYIANAPVDLFPWSLFLPWIVIYSWRNRSHGAAITYLLAWIVPALVFFHLSAGKRVMYLLPLYPPFAILAARSMLDLIDSGQRRWLRFSAAVWILCLALAVTTPLLVRLSTFTAATRTGIWFVPAAAVVCLIWSALLISRRAWAHWIPAMAAQVAILLLAIGTGGFSAFNVYKTSKPFCAPIRALEANGLVTVESLGLDREEYVFYSDTFIRVSLLHPGETALGAESQEKRHRLAGRRRVMQIACANGGSTAISLDESARRDRREAIVAAINNNGVDTKEATKYLNAVEAEVQSSLAEIDSDVPIAIIVRKEDWAWIVAFAPSDIARLSLVHAMRVTSRNMLLLANEAAQDALRGLE